MPQTLCVEGADRDQLIAGIRATYGESTAITDITIVRQGGVGGFFAREIYRVSFEPVSDAMPIPAAMPAPAAEPMMPVAVTPVPVASVPVTPVPVTPWPTPTTTPVDGRGRHRAASDADVAEPPESSYAAGSHYAAPAANSAPAGLDNLDALLSSADRADGPVHSPAPTPVPAHLSGPTQSDVDTFAALLASINSPLKPSVPIGPPASVPPPPLTYQPPLISSAPNVPYSSAPTMPIGPTMPAGATGPTGPIGLTGPNPPARPTSRPGVDVRTRVEMLSGLRAVGIPVADNPQTTEISLYRAIEQIVDELPPAPALPNRAGDVVVVVGAPDQVPAAASMIAARLHLSLDSIWRTGPIAGYERVITGPMDAAAQLPTIREATTPSVITVEIDPDRDDQRFGWAPQLVAALQPNAVWAAVAAGRKVEDLRVELATLGPIDALIVSGATRTASPATVWDLDIPIAIVDGRAATAGTWAGLLFDALRGGG